MIVAQQSDQLYLLSRAELVHSTCQGDCSKTARYAYVLIRYM